MSAAGHTYDKGYRKWAKFDIDAALRSVDQEEEEGVNDKSPRDLEKEERERGNTKFGQGDFEGAVKSYTR
ncbi:unnamed protein product [Ectocarpus sp. 12 AP-2014]